MSDDKPTVAERITVGLIDQAVDALREVHTLTGFNKATSVNRALIMYAFVSQRLALGHDLLVRDNETGEVEKVTLS